MTTITPRRRPHHGTPTPGAFAVVVLGIAGVTATALVAMAVLLTP